MQASVFDPQARQPFAVPPLGPGPALERRPPVRLQEQRQELELRVAGQQPEVERVPGQPAEALPPWELPGLVPKRPPEQERVAEQSAGGRLAEPQVWRQRRLELPERQAVAEPVLQQRVPQARPVLRQVERPAGPVLNHWVLASLHSRNLKEEQRFEYSFSNLTYSRGPATNHPPRTKNVRRKSSEFTAKSEKRRDSKWRQARLNDATPVRMKGQAETDATARVQA